MGNKLIVISSLVIGGFASSDFSVVWSVFHYSGDEMLDSAVCVDHCILQKEENSHRMHLGICSYRVVCIGTTTSDSDKGF